jgi:hypothetical protein
MKKLINFFKDMYQTDKEGLFGMIILSIFFYLLYFIFLPIITGR